MDGNFFALVGVMKDILGLGLFVIFFSICSAIDENCTLKILAVPISSFKFLCPFFKQFISLLVFFVMLIITFIPCQVLCRINLLSLKQLS